jgi:hypothetical protein
MGHNQPGSGTLRPVVTVVIAAHITIDGVLRLPGTVISVPYKVAGNLIASGYAYVAPAGTQPELILASSVVVLGLAEALPSGLSPGTVVLRRTS